MALTRRGNRFQASIWPGFVDAMTALLLVLMFVLSIFMIVQEMLRETITGQRSELSRLGAEIAALSDALGMERSRAADLEQEVGALTGALGTARAEAEARAARVAALERERMEFLSEQERLARTLAATRAEVDAQAEAARLAAARREALEALIADLRAEQAGTEAARAALAGEVAALQAELSEEEAARLAEAAAAQALRDRLAGAEDELTAMRLALEAERARAEDTLTLLAAADAARAAAEAQAAETQAEAERRAALLAQADRTLAEQEAASAESQRRVILLNRQLAALRAELGDLQALLEASDERDAAAQVQIETLGNRLNAALARAAAEQRARAELEEAERIRLQEEARRLAEEKRDLESYRSEFFGELRRLLAGREGVRIVGDRFVFSSEVLFQTARAQLSPDGAAQIANVVTILRDVADDIPAEIDWILRVDGHTDDVPLAPGAEFADNWALSQARALSVVRYMIDELDFAPDRLAATGFGEFHPVAQGASDEARAQNRRIELKLTER
ncbi:peptidoglycan -binding protein [Rhodovulum sp.]|uniref:peptidoglycan -binding protein n=1 Tax=Rhodovulum sp. TaxID=34009 RepID=UPI0018261CD7|nr:peptidoglycan -binding protein [Rhodovulum sp.]HDR28110.1 peptidoglycan -binding protein [Rhodovulum sp.]